MNAVRIFLKSYPQIYFFWHIKIFLRAIMDNRVDLSIIIFNSRNHHGKKEKGREEGKEAPIVFCLPAGRKKKNPAN